MAKPIDITTTDYYKYASDVVGGVVLSCIPVKAACQRFLDDLERDDLEFRADKVEKCIEFIGLLRHFKDSSVGKPFILAPWQQFIVANIIGWYWRGTTERRFTSSYIEVTRKNGKALDISTPIPTPNGWTTMGELKVGDYVWGADGKPTKVTFATPIMHGHKCYEVTFSDGEKIVADADHNWYVNGKVMTTEEMLGVGEKLTVPLAKHLQGETTTKSVVAIKETESVPVRCITVDNADHLYCAGERYTVTHNTALAAALCLHFLVCDVAGAEVALAANSRKQAGVAFEFCEKWARQLDPKQKMLRAYRNEIRLNETNSKLMVFSSDSTRYDGFNCSFSLVDEYHAARDTKLRDVLKSSMVMRQNPHLCTITTAGFDKSSPCYALRTTAIEIAQGIKQDDSFFGIVYTLDEGDNWTDEKVWAKATPNLGVTVRVKQLREQVTSALNNPSEEVGVKTKNFNVWTDVSEVWIPSQYINACTAKVEFDDFDEDTEVIVGVDLAAVSDLTAVTYLFVSEEGRLFEKTFYYVPESVLEESPNREKYKYWKRTGQLKVTPGNVTDYDAITRDMIKVNERFRLRKIYYDSWNSSKWAIDATAEGLPLEPYSQAIGNFNKPTRELERLIRSKQLTIDNNEITRWCFANVALKRDHNDNIKPTKGQNKEGKIDGTISLITALGGYLELPRYSGTILVV